jgi:hypothetical protein
MPKENGIETKVTVTQRRECAERFFLKTRDGVVKGGEMKEPETSRMTKVRSFEYVEPRVDGTAGCKDAVTQGCGSSAMQECQRCEVVRRVDSNSVSMKEVKTKILQTHQGENLTG